MKAELTIAIPTYNRVDKLKICLKRVIDFTKDKNIEIIVSDNASTDNTENMIIDIQKDHPNVLYFRNKKNLGFDGNFLNCFEKASGKYIWLLGDDDFLLPGAIESVLECCEKNPVCMHLNSSVVKSIVPFEVGKPRFAENTILEFDDRNEFIEKIGIYCTFVSGLVFNAELVKKIENKEKYFHTNFMQSHILLEIMKNEGKYIVDTYNCLGESPNETVSYDLFTTWIKNYSELFLNTAVQSGFDKNRMDEILRKDLSNTIYDFVIHFRKTCAEESKWNRESIWQYINRYPELSEKYRNVIYCSVEELDE